ncbi:MAG: MoaD/ThiS family protein [Acidimicrobiia bacterium]|nr:MoaD/ThiS family protein [Actinomycetota bacterium]MBL6925445.1 MoaD/ThiS family protein [Acidimicrobiia bacterium]MBL6926716.1 MoaD/ThiS family protein [Acidimicrobiia bacterium]
MPVLRLFASVRLAAGTGRTEMPGSTVGEVVDAARHLYGESFTEQLSSCGIWLNGEPAAAGDPVTDFDEVAILPPVSGG